MFIQNKVIQCYKQSCDFKLMTTTTPHLEVQPNDLEVFSVDEADNIRMHIKESSNVISKFSAKSKKQSITVITYNPKFKILFVGREDGTIDYYIPSSKQKNKESIKPHFSSINNISFSSDFKKMVTSSNDKKIKIFDIQKVQNKTKIKFLLTINSHTAFVKKAIFSADTSHIYSIDENTYRVTKVASTVVHGPKENIQITNVINEKEEIMTYKSQNNIQDFYKVNEFTLVLCYRDCSFEILNLKSQAIIKQFKLGQNFVLNNCSYAEDTSEILVNFCDDSNQKKVIVLDVLQLNQQTFEINNQKSIKDIYFSNKDRQIITFQNSKLLRKNPPKKQKSINSQIDQENRDLNIKKQDNNQCKVQMLQQLGQFSLALQKITEGFQQLDKKLTQNEQRTQNLIERFQQKQQNQKENDHEQYMSDFQMNQKDTLVNNSQHTEGSQKIQDDPLQNFQNYQLKYNEYTIEETEKRLKESLQTESIQDKTEDFQEQNFDLEQVQKFISERDNFSFKKDNEVQDDDNIFEDVIGKTLREKTVTFKTEDNNSNIMGSFRITDKDNNIIFNTFDHQYVSPEDLQYTTYNKQLNT